MVATAMSGLFFSLDPSNFPNHAKIMFRLDMGAGKDTFERLVGDQLAGNEPPDTPLCQFGLLRA